MSFRRFLSWPRHGIDYRSYLRLRRAPPRVPVVVPFYRRTITASDGLAFLSSVDEIFNRRVYDFVASSPQPRIIDCGANIGLSCIFFKQRYPDCRLVAFEPDPQLFAALRANLAAFGYADVELHQRALWNAATTLDFRPDGALAGRLMADEAQSTAALVTVEAVRLRDFLTEPVELLKIDIEGAELTVLEDCADRLDIVQRLFVEYHSFAETEQSLHRLLELLHAAGFRYHLRTGYVAATPFLARPVRDGMDLQLEIYAVRNSYSNVEKNW